MAAQLLWASALPENSMMPPSNTARTRAFSEGAAIDTREHFCRALRAARERSGVALRDIAEVTKVCITHYEALERGDLSRWPKGIFRRTFFRGYVERIGVAVAETTEEFLRLFPDEDGIAAAPRPVVQETVLRLGLDASWHGPKTPIISRLLVAMADSFVVIMLTSIAWIAGLEVATAAAVTSCAYFTLGMLLCGESPAAWIKRRRPAPATVRGGRASQQPAGTESPEPTVTAWRRGFEIARFAVGASEVETPDESPVERPWVSDARRVRPRETTPRTRVRLKFPASGGVHH